MSLSVLFTESKKVKFKGVEIEIFDISFRDLPLITPIVQRFLTGQESTKEKILKLIESDSDKLARLITNVTSIKAEEVGKLRVDALVFIVAKIIEHNVDFVKKNIPELRALIRGIAEKTGSELSKS